MKHRRLTRGALIGLVVACSAACGPLPVDVVGNAMAPALRDGGRARVTVAFDSLNRGDIVAFKYPRDESKSFVMRIVGLPGEQLEIREGAVAIDGRVLEEPYVIDANRAFDDLGPLRLDRDEYFVLGDNRRDSSDSRTWGPVRLDLIWAKVIDR
jgi:signal peptidase I